MRYLMIQMLLATLTLTVPISAQKLSPAAQYMQNFNKDSDSISRKTWEYASAAAHSGSARKVEGQRKALIKTILAAINKIKKIPVFEGDASLRDGIANVWTLNYHLLNDDYGRIIDLEEVAEQSYDAMEAYHLAREKANEKMQSYIDELQETERRFAKAHDVTLISTTNDISRKLTRSSAVMDYNTKLYLIFFKCYKQEAYLLSATSARDINAVEQNRQSLLKACRDSLDVLKVTPSFEGDDSLIQACRNFILFCLDEAESAAPRMVDYFVKNENFDKINRAFNSKKKNERTQADVDQFNEQVRIINEAVNQFNEMNNRQNLERSKTIDGWNTASGTFLDTKVPK